jgi:NADH-quinone oxidoreductase subunit B
MGLEDLQHNFLTGRLEDLVKWARTYSMWPATFGLACCAIEMMSVGAADFDLARFGMEVFRASPRQADLMIVAGRVSQKMAPVLRQVYDQMMEPKWVLSMGVCASTGGMFNNYAIVQGVDQIVPVDVYAPGCPPTPETLMHAILTLHEKVRTNDITRRGPAAEVGLAGGSDTGPLADDQGADTDDGRTSAEETTTGWTPDRPDAVHLGTPKRNPVIARSVGEPL